MDTHEKYFSGFQVAFVFMNKSGLKFDENKYINFKGMKL